MSAEQTVPTLDRAYALRPSLLTPGRQRQPVFWLALLAAALAHAVLVVGISQAPPNYLGDPSGNAEAIDVEIVDEGQLRAMSSPQAPAEAPPSPPPAAQAAAPAQEPPPPEPETTPEAVPETAPETAPPQKSAARPTSEAEEAQAAPPPEALPKPAPPQEDVKKESPPKKESAAKPKPKTAIKPPAKLDLSVPLNLTMQGAASGGGGAASTRPPGITRSGANDRFGRDVIRALKKTMPPSDGVTGKVKVRIFLNERGNVAWVRVVNSSGDRLLDDSVTFSVHQSSFPFPPKGATVADRTFLVTYIYR